MPSGCLWVLTERSDWRRPHVETVVVCPGGVRSVSKGSQRRTTTIEAPLLARVSTGESSSSESREKVVDYRGTTRPWRDSRTNERWNSGMLRLSGYESCWPSIAGRNGAARRATRHTSRGSRHREKKRIDVEEERRSASSGDGTDIRTDDEASRPISYRVRSFVRSVRPLLSQGTPVCD